MNKICESCEHQKDYFDDAYGRLECHKVLCCHNTTSKSFYKIRPDKIHNDDSIQSKINKIQILEFNLKKRDEEIAALNKRLGDLNRLFVDFYHRSRDYNSVAFKDF